MSAVVVYTARPERVLAVAAHLQAHGLASRVAHGSAMTFPWVVAGLPRSQLVVSEHSAGRARELLRDLQADEASSTGSLQSSMRWWLVILALSPVVGVGLVLSSISGGAAYTLGGLGCFALLVVALVRLRAATPAAPTRP